MDTQAAQIGWMVGRHLRFAAALLLGADGDGLLILADDAPQVGDLALLRVPGLLPHYWVEARTLAASRLRSGPYEIRLDFTRRPSRAFLAAMSLDEARRN
jgi:hypothetical protein